MKNCGVSPSGLANAWQYFMVQALSATTADGVVALIVPYEWVTRPSSAAVRDHIRQHNWGVSVYRLEDSTFDSVLTTASITIIDKSASGSWAYFLMERDGTYRQLQAPVEGTSGVLGYRSRARRPGARLKRGLSPGSQKVFTLTEGERIRNGLSKRDVVPCVTTLRHLPGNVTDLDNAAWADHFKDAGARCWLINTEGEPSKELSAYLDAVPAEVRDTATCRARDPWWRYKLPEIPAMLASLTFKGMRPKVVKNTVAVRAVGSASGINNILPGQQEKLLNVLLQLDLRDRVVAYAHGLRKIEVGQFNMLLSEILDDA